MFRSARRIIALTDEQRDALMTTSVGGADPDLWLFVAFGLNTAMRHSEIMSARWDRLGLGYLSPSPRPASASSQSPLSWAELPERECEMRDDREGRVFPSLRYAHVHGRQIDEAIRVIGRTLPKGLGNETALTMTQELPTAANVAPIKGTEKPKDGLLFQGFVGWRPEAGLASICGTGLNIIRWDNTIPPCSVVFRPHCPTDRP